MNPAIMKICPQGSRKELILRTIHATLLSGRCLIDMVVFPHGKFYLKYIIKLTTVALLLTINGFAQTKPLTEVPFFIKEEKIYFKCRVNHSDSLTFLFDTGASPMVIADSVAVNRLRLKMDSEVQNEGANGISTVKVTRHHQLNIGNLDIAEVSFVSIPYPGYPFDGVLGLEVMKRYVIKVDYKSRKLLFYDRAAFVYQGTGIRLKVKYLHNVPTIAGSIHIGKKRYKGRFEIDTGSDTGLDLTSPFVNKYHLRDSLKTIAISTALGSDGTSSRLYVVRMPEVRLGDFRFYVIPAGLATATKGLMSATDIQGVLGNKFLKRFNITYDLSRGQVYLEPNDLLHSKYFDWL